MSGIPTKARYHRYIPGICQVYSRYIPGISGIFQVYFRYIPGKFQVYVRYIPGIFQVFQPRPNNLVVSTKPRGLQHNILQTRSMHANQQISYTTYRTCCFD